jgi:hypothetical protein
MFRKYDGRSELKKNARQATGVEGGVMQSLEVRRDAEYRKIFTVRLQLFTRASAG